DLNDPAHYALANALTSSPYDSWNTERDRFRAQATTAYSGYAHTLVDLDYYGGYTYVPGYGRIWRPFGVTLGWSPFDDGAWAYYGGYGYRFISAYPWGWLPYNCG